MSTIAQQLAALAQIKADIKAAIEAKGVTVGSVAFDEYADLIAEISGGGGGSDENFLKLIDRTIATFTFPSGITKIGDYSFANCAKLSTVTIPNTVTTIGAQAFYSSTVKTISIPGSVTSIGSSCFQGSGLQQITLPSGLTLINTSMFNNCGSLTYVDLPSTIVTINNTAFNNVAKLNTLICRATTPPAVGANSFGNGASTYAGRSVASGKKLYVPQNCSSAYTGATGTQWVDTLLNASKCNFAIAELDANGNIPT